MISIDHLVLRCIDIESTKAFYELIGMTFVREQHGAGPEHLAAELNGVAIELYPASSTRPPEVGLRIGLMVGDVDAAAEALSVAGHQERDASPSSYVDPDGRIVVVSTERGKDG